MLLAAIGAVASIRPHEAAAILDALADLDDEDVREAVDEAMALMEERSVEDDADDDILR